MRAAFPLEQLGLGINLRDQPALVEPGQALACLDVLPTERGGICQRPGYEVFATAPSGNLRSLGTHEESDGTRQLIGVFDNQLRAYDAAGTALGSAATANTTGEPPSFGRIAAPGLELTFIASRGQAPRQYDGVAFTTPTCTVNGTAGQAMGKGGLVAVQTPDVRLAMAGFNNGANGPGGLVVDESTVVFSNPGHPEIYETNGTSHYANHVRLDPGDGERIAGLVSWRDRLFAFKQSKFFVFWGNSENANGSPNFNWREESVGVGAIAPGSVCVGRDGVYFVHRDGIYRTTGEGAEQVSDAIDPLFTAQVPQSFSAEGEGPISGVALTNIRMGWHGERVYCAYTSEGDTTNNRLLVFDPRYGWWVIWSLAADALASFTAGGRPSLIWGTGTAIRKMDGSAELDGSVKVPSYWQGGWSALGDEGVKTWRQAVAIGQGNVRVRVLRDFFAGGVSSDVDFGGSVDRWGGGTDPSDRWAGGTDPSDLWGGGSDIGEEGFRATGSLRGRLFSLRLEALPDGRRWFVHRFTHHTFGHHARLTGS